MRINVKEKHFSGLREQHVFSKNTAEENDRFRGEAFLFLYFGNKAPLVFLNCVLEYLILWNRHLFTE